MASTTTPDPDREYRLIEQLELRIATANTDEKFEGLISRFLPALLLKLASENARNRNLAIKVCQHVNQRAKITSTILLPVQPLVKVFREAENAFVRRFSLIFIEQGLGRLPKERALEMLPDILKFSVPERMDYDSTDSKMWAIAFDFLLDVLRNWKTPNHASKEDDELRSTFTLSLPQTNILATQLCKFVLFEVKGTENKTLVDDDFLQVFEKHTNQRSGVVVPIAKFLFTSIFTDQQRLLPATILAVDPNPGALSVSDTMFKQCNFDLEADDNVNALFDLYENAKPKLQIKILSLLSKSQKSTKNAQTIMKMIEKQLSSGTSGLEASRLRTSLFSYLTWTVRVSQSLGDVRQKVQTVLKDYVELQGWPTMAESSHAEVELRAKAYESIGLLATPQKLSETSGTPAPSLDLITWLFTSLRCDTTRDIRSSIEEALSRIMMAISFKEDEAQDELKQLLLWNTIAKPGDEDPIYFFPSANDTKYLAVRFANKCLPFDDVDARFIDVLAMAPSDRREVSEEGARGFDPYWHSSNLKLIGDQQTSATLRMPQLSSIVFRFFGDQGLKAHKNYYNQLSVLTAAVVFARNILICEALEGSSSSIGTEADWKQQIDAVISNDINARNLLRDHINKVNSDSIQLLLGAALDGLSMGNVECAETALELLSLCDNQTLLQVREKGLACCTEAIGKTDVLYRASRIFGILGSLDIAFIDNAKTELDNCTSWESVVGEQAVRVQSHLLRVSFLVTRALLRKIVDSNIGLVNDLFALLSMIIMRSSDKSIKDAAYLALGQLALCAPRGSNIINVSDELINKILSDAKKENEAAVSSLGRLLGYAEMSGQRNSCETILEKMYALHDIKKAEFQFTLGESLTVAGAGFKSSSALTELDVDISVPESGYHEELLSKLVVRANEGCRTTKPGLKRASAIWLLSLVQYCGELSPIKRHLQECQASFARLLNDREEIVQETGARGLSLVYEKGDKTLRDDLVRDLVQSFTGTNAKMSGTVDEDTQLFEAGSLPTENGQSITTYKDIVSLATEMGDPSLVYRFMNLASHNAIWSSRAAFGRFGLGNVLADSSYLNENKKFYPKLFRYRFDPNPNVQRSMNEIWKALVKDPNTVIEQNFDLIIEDLLKSALHGRDWRAREASCGAIADLVQGRELNKYEKYLDEIWKVSFKVLDDVKETVRIAAMKLCRTLTTLLIRNLEVGEGTTRRATTMLNHAFPFLLQQMDTGAAKEVQQYAIITLLEVVKKSPPKTLKPFAPVLLETLINSLSSLEHESINYLHLNADKYGLTAEKLDNMRVSSINASPVTQAIDSCLESLTSTDVNEVIQPEDAMEGVESTSASSTTPMQDAMRRLEGTFKSAIGLPSRVGLSRVMVTLVVRHHAAFRPFADRFVQLTRKNILDRNATISVAFSMALGYLMRLSSEKEIRSTSKYAQQLYFDSQELSHRSVAGEILQAVSKTANDVFMNFATIFLPFAFVGRNDTDEQVRERFDNPWKDNIGGARAVNLYLKEIVALIASHLKSPLWPIRHACCLALADLIVVTETHNQYSEQEAALLWPLVQDALSGKTWDGKEKVVLAYPKFIKQTQVLWGNESTTKTMKMIAMREAKRTNASYRAHAILSLSQFVSARRDLDLSVEVTELLRNLTDELKNDDDMDVDGTGGMSSEKLGKDTVDRTLCAVVTCLFETITMHANMTILDSALQIAQRAIMERSGSVDMALYDGATKFVRERGSPKDEKDKAGNRSENEVFFEQLVLALLADDEGRYPTSPENQRKSRVKLALALAQSGSLTPTARAKLMMIFEVWLKAERSRPVRADIEEAQRIVAN